MASFASGVFDPLVFDVAPYFLCSYFDDAYFDVDPDCITDDGGHGPLKKRPRRRPVPEPVFEPVFDDDELFVLI